MSQQVMKMFTDNDYIVSETLDYGLDRFVTSKQNYVDLMTQHRTKEIYNVNNIRSSNLKLS